MCQEAQACWHDQQLISPLVLGIDVVVHLPVSCPVCRTQQPQLGRLCQAAQLLAHGLKVPDYSIQGVTQLACIKLDSGQLVGCKKRETGGKG